MLIWENETVLCVDFLPTEYQLRCVSHVTEEDNGGKNAVLLISICEVDGG